MILILLASFTLPLNLVALPLNDVDEKELMAQLRDAGVQNMDEIHSVLENVEAIRSARSRGPKYGYDTKYVANNEYPENIRAERIESLEPVRSLEEIKSVQPVRRIKEVEAIQPIANLQEIERIEEVENVVPLSPRVVDRFLETEGLSWKGQTRWDPYSESTSGRSISYGNRELYGTANMDYDDVQRILNLFDINDLSQIIQVIPIKNIKAVERLGFSRDRIENIVQSARIQEAENIRSGRVRYAPRIQKVGNIRPARIQEVGNIRPARIQEVDSIRPARIQEVDSIRPLRIQEVESIRPVIYSQGTKYYKGGARRPESENPNYPTDNFPSRWEGESNSYAKTESSKSRILQLIREIDQETKVLRNLKNQLELSMLKLKSIRELTKQHLSRYQNLINRLDVLQSRLKGSSTARFEVYDSVPKNEEGSGANDDATYGFGIKNANQIFGNAYNIQKVDNMREVVSKKEVADLQKVTGLQEIDRLEEVEEMTPVKSIQEVKRILPLTDRQADRLLTMHAAASKY